MADKTTAGRSVVRPDMFILSKKQKRQGLTAKDYRMYKSAISILFLWLLSNTCSAQDVFFSQTDSADQRFFPKHGFLQVGWQTGKLLDTHTDGLDAVEQHPFYALDIRYGVYGYGRKQWHQLHQYPAFGVGLTRFWFTPTDNIIGNPLSGYFFYHETLLDTRRSALAYDFSLGLSCLWKPYDPQTNTEQRAIGSAVNVSVSFKLQYALTLSPRMDLLAGAGVDHFSNGRVRSPNRGLNMVSLNVATRYRLRPRKPSGYEGVLSYQAPTRLAHDITPFHRLYECAVLGTASIVTTFKDINNRSNFFWTSSASVDLARHYSYTGKYGIGFDLFYDGSVQQHYQPRYGHDVPTHLLWWPGIHVSHGYMIHRWTFTTQAGLNLNGPSNKGSWYGRIALRYDLSRRLFIRSGIRVYDTFISDFIETGIGLAFYKR